LITWFIPAGVDQECDEETVNAVTSNVLRVTEDMVGAVWLVLLPVFAKVSVTSRGVAALTFENNAMPPDEPVFALMVQV